MTYEQVCAKLGFDPMVNPPKYVPPKNPSHIDDSEVSPYAKLTYEESLIIWDRMFGKK